MPLCQATTQSGRPCDDPALPGSQWCYNHAPDKADARIERARKGARTAGKGRPKIVSTETQHIKARIAVLIRKVLDGSLPSGRVAVACQLINTALRAVEIERRELEANDKRLTREEAQAFVDALLFVVNTRVSDQQLVRAIIREAAELLGEQPATETAALPASTNGVTGSGSKQRIGAIHFIEEAV